MKFYLRKVVSLNKYATTAWSWAGVPCVFWNVHSILENDMITVLALLASVFASDVAPHNNDTNKYKIATRMFKHPNIVYSCRDS